MDLHFLEGVEFSELNIKAKPIYAPLNPELSQIRVLTPLEPCSEPGKLRLRMDVVSLDDVTDEYRTYKAALPEARRRLEDFQDWLAFICDRHQHDAGYVTEDLEDAYRYTWGDFIALSYEWGIPSNTEQVEINGGHLQIRSNLGKALRALSPVYNACRKNRWPMIWADALCINQSDKCEVTCELKRLCTIFSIALRTIVWVGEEENNSEKAIQVLQEIADYKSFEQARPLLSPESLLSHSGCWHALDHFLHRSYWKRLWVLQELILSHKRARIYCGAAKTGMRDMIEGSKRFYNESDHFEKLIVADWKAAGKKRTTGPYRWCEGINVIQAIPNLGIHVDDSNLQIVQLMQTAHNSQQERPQDKIYGLLGVLPPEVTALIEPSLEKAPQAVYQDLMVAVIAATGSLIQFSGDIKHTDGNPTWVPDLMCREENHITPLVLRRTPSFQASGNTRTILDVSGGGKLLLCRGYLLGFVGSASNSSWVQESGGETNSKPLAFDWQHELDISDTDLLWLTLLAGGNDYSEPLTRVPDSLRRLHWVGDQKWESALEHGCFDGSQDFVFRILKAFCRRHRDAWIRGRSFKSYFSSEMMMCKGTDLAEYLERVFRVVWTRQLITTDGNCVGLGPVSTESGDVLAILHGGRTPVILRPCPDGTFKLVGDCYFHGLMDGEVIDGPLKDRFELRDITLC